MNKIHKSCGWMKLKTQYNVKTTCLFMKLLYNIRRVG